MTVDDDQEFNSVSRDRFNPADGDALCLSVIGTVAQHTDVEFHDLDPLAYTIDMDALARLMTSERDSSLQVDFEYSDCNVTITNDGCVTITDRASEE